MVTCYKQKYQKYILAIVIWFILGKQNSLVAKPKMLINLNSDNSYLAQAKIKDNKMLVPKLELCQQIDPASEEVYSFETEEYYINICQLDNSFYYHRQSKTNANNTLLIPAKSVFGGDVFQATYGKTIYFAGRDGDRYYSSVMQNNSEIVFEPEIQPNTISVDAIEPVSSNSRLAVNNSGLEDKTEASLELEIPKNNTEQSLVCTREKSALHPRLKGWQQLIGKSPDIANKYAVNNGHSFIYDGDAPEEALIETKEGAVINLNIAAISETIDRVCVQPVADRQ